MFKGFYMTCFGSIPNPHTRIMVCRNKTNLDEWRECVGTFSALSFQTPLLLMLRRARALALPLI